MVTDSDVTTWSGRTQESKNREIISVKDFGAIGDGAPHPLSERFSTLAAAQAVYPFVTSLLDQIDWAAIQATIDYLDSINYEDYTSGFNAGAGVCLLPAGCFRINKTIIQKNRISIKGVGRRNTMILATSGFSGDSLIQQGLLASGVVFNCMVESLSLNTNFDSTIHCVLSGQASEGSGIRDVITRGTFKPVRYYKVAPISSGTPGTPTECLIENSEFWLEGSGIDLNIPIYAIEIDQCQQSNVIRFITVIDISNKAAIGSASIKVNASSVQIDHIHSEKLENGVLVQSTVNRVSNVVIKNIEHYGGKATTAICIDDHIGNLNINVENAYCIDPIGSKNIFSIKNLKNGDMVGDRLYTSYCAFYNYRSNGIFNINGTVIKADDLYIENRKAISHKRVSLGLSIENPILAGGNYSQTYTVNDVLNTSNTVVNIVGGGSNIIVSSGGGICAISCKSGSNTITLTLVNISQNTFLPNSYVANVLIFI